MINIDSGKGVFIIDGNTIFLELGTFEEKREIYNKAINVKSSFKV